MKKTKKPAKAQVSPQPVSPALQQVQTEKKLRGIHVMKGFLDFIREQGVVGLAVGFIMGGAVSKVVSSLVADIINPFLGIILGAAGNLSEATFQVGNAVVAWGKFVSVLIDFSVIALVVYFGVKMMKLDQIDKKKS
jgi:large conductance mechanosensitive channel